MAILNTEYGEIQVLDITDELFKTLQERLTYGFVRFKESFNGSDYGFVVRCGVEEIPCLKQQPVDMDKETAMRVLNLHANLIVDTMCQLSKENPDCIYYATPYFKDKGNGKFESGIAHYIFPGENVDSEVDLGMGRSVAPYDNALGKGATKLSMKFIQMFNAHFNDKFRIPYIGLDIRTRSQLGSLVSGFMLVGDKIIFHGAKADERDPRFATLARHGFKTIYHAPSAPMTISEEQLKEAKGNSQ